jgi:hypothetical protein
VQFHFSPRYAAREAELRAELETAFRFGDAHNPHAALGVAVDPAGLMEVKHPARPGQ